MSVTFEQLTVRHLESLYRVKVDPTMADFRDVLKMMFESTKDDMVVLPEEKQYRVAQGRAQQLRDILSLIEMADSLLERKSGQKTR